MNKIVEILTKYEEEIKNDKIDGAVEAFTNLFGKELPVKTNTFIFFLKVYTLKDAVDFAEKNYDEIMNNNDVEWFKGELVKFISKKQAEGKANKVKFVEHNGEND